MTDSLDLYDFDHIFNGANNTIIANPDTIGIFLSLYFFYTVRSWSFG
jgi:hypothetical protein